MKPTTEQIIINGNCLDVLKTYVDNFFDSVVTDPPYGLKFMLCKWDHSVPSVDIWRECFRVLKPGGHMLVACGTRTQHRMVVNIEDAGFEIRDVITWHYGSGFPKNMDVGKAIDNRAGAEREVVGKRKHPTLKNTELLEETASAGHGNNTWAREWDITAPHTQEAKQWDGWGTALKPATEFWTLCRKPIEEDTVADNVLKHRTGGLNIDACRIKWDAQSLANDTARRKAPRVGIAGGRFHAGRVNEADYVGMQTSPKGRFPANVIFDEYTAKLLDDQSGVLTTGAMLKSYAYKNNGYSLGKAVGATKEAGFHEADEGGASRFFYCAKASRSERNMGLENFKAIPVAGGNQAAELKRGNTEFASDNPNKTSYSEIKYRQNFHPTVKPVKLMRYLVKLVTPPLGHVLDPFAGSGTTGIGCKAEQFNFTGIDITPEYCNISRARIAGWRPDPTDVDDNQLSLFDFEE